MHFLNSIDFQQFNYTFLGQSSRPVKSLEIACNSQFQGFFVCGIVCSFLIKYIRISCFKYYLGIKMGITRGSFPGVHSRRKPQEDQVKVEVSLQKS